YASGGAAPEAYSRRSCAPSGRRRRQQPGQPVVARLHAALHTGLEDRIARRARLVAHGIGEGGPSALLDEDERTHGLARVPRLVELLGADDPLGRLDLPVHAPHPHLGPIAIVPPHVAVLAAPLQLDL